MANIEDKIELAEIAYQGENYSDAYKKFSDVVEEDIKNKTAWIGKGLAAGRLANLENNTLKESNICLEKANEMGLTPKEKEYIAAEILKISNDFIQKANQSVTNILTEKDKKPMATGELYAVRKVSQLADRVAAFNNHWEHYEKAIEFSWLSLQFNDSIQSKKGLLKNIDFILRESKQNFHKDYVAKLKKWRADIVGLIKKDDPNFSATPVKTDSGNCFIATAAYGSYNFSTVIELREFRDKHLQKSLAGRKFIQYYYLISPPIAKVIAKNEFLRLITRKFIDNTLVKIVRFMKQ